jgi:hypothetical protein
LFKISTTAHQQSITHENRLSLKINLLKRKRPNTRKQQQKLDQVNAAELVFKANTQ